jgi:hypothetical protein
MLEYILGKKVGRCGLDSSGSGEKLMRGCYEKR